MLCVPGLDFKSYFDLLSGDQPLPEIPCPDPACGSLLRGHGWYRRYLNGELFAMRRLICPRCKVTHALLPEDVCAYRDVTLTALESALDSQGGPGACARAAQQAGLAGRRRARRWLRAQQDPWAAQLRGFLPAVAGDLWGRIRALVGLAAGALVRFRHWLWSTYRYFFSGLTGLFRHGRPGWAVRGDSTDFGIWAETA